MLSLTARHARTQRTHAAHREVNRNAGLRRPIQGFNHVLIEQGIHLGNDPRWPAVSGMFGFTMDLRQRGGGKINRRDGQRSVAGRFRIGREIVENRVYRRSNIRRSRKQAQVSIEA